MEQTILFAAIINNISKHSNKTTKSIKKKTIKFPLLKNYAKNITINTLMNKQCILLNLSYQKSTYNMLQTA
jgi:hypothetical protein